MTDIDFVLIRKDTGGFYKYEGNPRGFSTCTSEASVVHTSSTGQLQENPSVAGA